MNKYTMSHLQLTKWILPSKPFDTQWGNIIGSRWLKLEQERLRERGIEVEIITDDGKRFALMRKS